MKLSLVLAVILIANNELSAQIVPRVDPLVQIDQGLVRGQLATDGDYSYFLGIPYAQVDVANPFGPAQPHPGFGGEVFDADDASIICPQLYLLPRERQITRNYVENIDCLRLNVYTPNSASSQDLLPVFVWIHGGTYATGWGTENHPRALAELGIVVVTINYRLGAYGFMCLDTPVLPGNTGLKDQYQALRWVQNNIAAFGGDPYDVTIGGQSAGATSILLHLFSYSEKLFAKVIAESGSPQTEGHFVVADLEAATKIALYLGFNTTDSEEALQFLSTLPPETVQSATANLHLILRPCRELSYSSVENYINVWPFSFDNIDKVRDTPILIGHTDQEEYGLGMMPANYYDTDPFFNRLGDNFYLTEEDQMRLGKLARHFYIGDKEISTNLTFVLGHFESDFKLNHPIQRIINVLLNLEADPIYEYVFSYVGDSGNLAAGHMAELPYLFDREEGIPDTDEARLVAARVTTLWANFIKYGNPTPTPTELLPVAWSPITPTTRPYLNIDAELELRSRVFQDRMAFWDLIFLVHGKKHRLNGCSVSV